MNKLLREGNGSIRVFSWVITKKNILFDRGHCIKFKIENSGS